MGDAIFVRRGESLLVRCGVVVALLFGGVASAGSVDIWGFGPRSMGAGVGGVALVDGPEGTLLNPAGLAWMDGQRLVLGYAVQRARFRPVPDVYWDTNADGRVDGADVPMSVEVDPDRADGAQMALGRAVGERFGIAIGAFFPVDRLLRIRTTEPSLPTYFLYDNRPHRYELSLGFGWEQLPGLSVGGSVEMLSQARYAIDLVVDVPVSGAEQGDSLGDILGPIGMDVRGMELDLAPSFAPVAAITWDLGESVGALDGLILSVVYRGATGMPVDINVDVQGNFSLDQIGDLEPLVLTVLAPISIDMLDHYVPERLTLGAGWRSESVEFYAEGRRTGWDRMRVNVSQVTEASVQTQLVRLSDPTIYDRNGYAIRLQPTWGANVGGVWRSRVFALESGWESLQFVGRAGWLLAPSPLVSQGRSSTFLDADRMGFTVGGGVVHGEPFGLVGGPLRLDFFLQYHLLASGTLQVRGGAPARAGTPIDGAPVPVGGRLIAAGGHWSVDF